MNALSGRSEVAAEVGNTCRNESNAINGNIIHDSGTPEPLSFPHAIFAPPRVLATSFCRCAHLRGRLQFEGERMTPTNERHCVNSVSVKFVKEPIPEGLEEAKVV